MSKFIKPIIVISSFLLFLILLNYNLKENNQIQDQGEFNYQEL